MHRQTLFMNEGKAESKMTQEWLGYLRQDGRKGIRNKILVMYTVECAAFVAKEIVRLAEDSEVEVVGFAGCTDNQYAVRLMGALLRHPNVGGALVVGLGCEYVQANRLAELTAISGRLSEWLLIQDLGGTTQTVAEGLAIVQKMQAELKKVPRVPMQLKDLVVGCECGGSDFTSGLAGNAVVGRFFDQLVALGGTAIFEEIVEAIGLKKMLMARGKTAAATAAIGVTYDKALTYCQAVRQYSVSPGNFVGGLSTIEEKSMGAIVKSGTQPIEGVLKVGEPPAHAGLWLLDSTPDPYWMQYGITNPNDTEGLMDLIASGCQVVFLVTGRGSVVGSAVAPCLKITGNSETYQKMVTDMDFDAGRTLTGELSMTELAAELLAQVVTICQGIMSKSESLGHKEYLIPYKYQKNFKIRKCEVE